ncbi:hypothetical protein BJV82DRAFT_590080 [Fennellomyces sp. T-0311]|nr:hypothetical protein BJV82DRAFT_590080 [Fennellomyces sp. T-0311]
MERSRWGHFLYTSSLFFLIVLTAACIAISAADVIVQALFDQTESGRFDLRNLFVVAASYVVLAIAALAFTCSRFFTIRASLQDIPKIYIPIKKDDLPKKVYSQIQGQFDAVKHVRKLAEPRPEDIVHIGRGKPGDAQFAGVDFKRVIARTPMFIEQAAMAINPAFSRPSHVPTRQYIEYLIQRSFIDAQIGQVYIDGYERARFSRAPVSQDIFREIMTHLAVILDHMGYSDRGQGSAGESASLSSSSGGSTSHQHHQHRRQSSGDRSARTPRDDDVASLAQSIATWTSRSTSNTRSRYPRSNSQRSTQRNQDEDSSSYQDDEDGNNYDDYDQQLRQVIYNRLVIDRF